MFVGFVSVLCRKDIYEWHAGRAEHVYHTPTFNTREEAEKYIQREVLDTHPDSNFANDGKNNHAFWIQYIILDVNREEFEILRGMITTLAVEDFKKDWKVEEK